MLWSATLQALVIQITHETDHSLRDPNLPRMLTTTLPTFTTPTGAVKSMPLVSFYLANWDSQSTICKGLFFILLTMIPFVLYRKVLMGLQLIGFQARKF